MNCGVMTIAYNEEILVRGNILSFRPFVQRHVYMVSDKPFYGDMEPLDRTAEIAESMGAEVTVGNWKDEATKRNAGLAQLQEMDWIFISDVDFWIEKSHMEKLVEKLKNTDSRAFIIKQKSYWYDTNHAFVGDNFKPVIAVRPGVKFVHIGNIDTPFEIIDDIYIHHLAWCSPKDILKKVKTYSHAPEFNGEKWYFEKFINWYGGSAELPTGIFEIERDPLPEELRAYL